jgi:voltage-gated potassium channel
MDEKLASEKAKHEQDIVHRHSVTYNLFILVLTVFSLVVVAGIILRPAGNAVLWRVDFLICMVFLLDFGLNLWRAPNKANYLFKEGGWLDLLGAIPSVPGHLWTSFTRLARLNRVVRIVKHLQGKDRDDVIEESQQDPARTALLTLIMAAFVLVTGASLLILVFERGVPGANIQTGATAFWWAMATVTTVGYGDYVPVTYPGRILAIALMTFGIGIFAVLTSFMAARVVRLQDVGRPGQEDIVRAIREENATIRAELAEIKRLLKQDRSKGDEETC